MAVWSIVRFNVLSNYKIEVSFADGTTGVAELAPRLSQEPHGDGFDPLCDQAVFAKVYLEHGAFTWPGGIRADPERRGIASAHRQGRAERTMPLRTGEEV